MLPPLTPLTSVSLPPPSLRDGTVPAPPPPTVQFKKGDLRIRLEIWLKEDDPEAVDKVVENITKTVPAFRVTFKRKKEDRRH